jgi:D-alanyl-lipoteichoic acid acyltransferase DltB (MBOAT superfamily)
LLKDGSPEKKNLAKRLLALVIIVNFGVLALFKLENEATAWLQPLALRLGLATDTGGLLLPLGISFYMFQGTGYLLDVYRGKIAPQKNYAKFALFISFFPQVVQGPISRFDWLSDQLTSQREFDYGRVRRAAQLILYGCFKKLVIADNIAPFTGSVFSGAAEQPGAMVALACVLGTLQLYCDFSWNRSCMRRCGDVRASLCRRISASRILRVRWRKLGDGYYADTNGGANTYFSNNFIKHDEQAEPLLA